MVVEPGTVCSRARETHAVEVVDEVVVLHEPTGELHVLNPTAAVVWGLLDGHRDVRELAVELAALTGADVEVTTPGLVDLLQQLVVVGVATTAPDST